MPFLISHYFKVCERTLSILQLIISIFQSIATIIHELNILFDDHIIEKDPIDVY